MSIKFGPAGLGPVKTAEKSLTYLYEKGLKACEVAFTYSIYIKPEEAELIGKKAKELGLDLSIHAPYWLNLNSVEKEKRDSSKKRILECCRIGEKLGAKLVVFHPGYYQDDKEKSYEIIKQGILDIMDEINKNKWKIKIAPETMGRVNVFGSIEEISRLVKETGCSFCIDYAHILARHKKVDYELIEKAFPDKVWHVHFSGIVYGDKGEKHHKNTEKKDWNELLQNLPMSKEIIIINESPTMVDDCLDGLKIYKKLK